MAGADRLASPGDPLWSCGAGGGIRTPSVLRQLCYRQLRLSRSGAPAWQGPDSNRRPRAYETREHSELLHPASALTFHAWTRPGSNRPPPVCKTGALPDELRALTSHSRRAGRTRSAIRTRTTTGLSGVPPASWATRACLPLRVLRRDLAVACLRRDSNAHCRRPQRRASAIWATKACRTLVMPVRGAASRNVDGVAQVVPASEPGGRRTRRSRPAQAAAPRTGTLSGPIVTGRKNAVWNCFRAAFITPWRAVKNAKKNRPVPGGGRAAAVPCQRLAELPALLGDVHMGAGQRIDRRRGGPEVAGRNEKLPCHVTLLHSLFGDSYISARPGD